MNVLKSLATFASLSFVAASIVACGSEPNGQADRVGSSAQAVDEAPDASADDASRNPSLFLCGTSTWLESGPGSAPVSAPEPTVCDKTTQYCEHVLGGIPGRSIYSCQPYSPTCVARNELSCACFARPVGPGPVPPTRLGLPQCEDLTGGGSRVTIYAP